MYVCLCARACVCAYVHLRDFTIHFGFFRFESSESIQKFYHGMDDDDGVMWSHKTCTHTHTRERRDAYTHTLSLSLGCSIFMHRCLFSLCLSLAMNRVVLWCHVTGDLLNRAIWLRYFLHYQLLSSKCGTTYNYALTNWDDSAQVFLFLYLLLSLFGRGIINPSERHRSVSLSTYLSLSIHSLSHISRFPLENEPGNNSTKKKPQQALQKEAFLPHPTAMWRDYRRFAREMHRVDFFLFSPEKYIFVYVLLLPQK